MTASPIEQLGLSAASSRVLQAGMESSLSGLNFKVGLAACYIVAAVFWSVSAGVIATLAVVAIRESQPLLMLGALLTLPFIIIPWFPLQNMRKLDRARRGA